MIKRLVSRLPAWSMPARLVWLGLSGGEPAKWHTCRGRGRNLAYVGIAAGSCVSQLARSGRHAPCGVCYLYFQLVGWRYKALPGQVIGQPTPSGAEETRARLGFCSDVHGCSKQSDHPSAGCESRHDQPPYDHGSAV
jgi:hypothetical protein